MKKIVLLIPVLLVLAALLLAPVLALAQADVGDPDAFEPTTVLVDSSTAPRDLTRSIVGPEAMAADQQGNAGLMLLKPALMAFRRKEYAVGAGMLLAFLIWIFNQTKLSERVPKQHRKWVPIGLSMLASISLGLQDGKPPLDIAITGVMVGLLAIGSWKTIGEPLDRKRKGGAA